MREIQNNIQSTYKCILYTIHVLLNLIIHSLLNVSHIICLIELIVI